MTKQWLQWLQVVIHHRYVTLVWCHMIISTAMSCTKAVCAHCICHQNSTFIFQPLTFINHPFHPSSKFCEFKLFSLFFFGGGGGQVNISFFLSIWRNYRVNYGCGKEGLFMVMRTMQSSKIHVSYFPNFEGGGGKTGVGKMSPPMEFFLKASLFQKMV